MHRDSYDDSPIQRGIDEAMACQDMLERAPARPSLLARIVARLVAAMRWVARSRVTSERQVISATPNVTRAP
jgi:hypothetical protein